MPRPPQHTRRAGFTLVEILFALALIAILVSMLFLGAMHLVGGAKERSTKVTLAALKGMFGEYESKTHLSKSPPTWLVYDASTMKAAAAKATDLWKVYDFSATEPRLPLDAPGLVIAGNYDEAAMTATDVSELNRNGSRQVLNTQLVMGMLLQMPANRDALAKLPPEMYFNPRWVSASGKLPAPGNDPAGGVLYLTPDATDDVYYPQGAKVIASVGGTGAQSIIKATPGIWQSASAPTVGALGSGSDWVQDHSPPTPLLLDAWGNPIIFVPGTGLRVRLLNGATNYNEPTVITAIVISSEGRVDMTTNPTKPVVLKEGRPFFASAGPDGDFAKGDDNIYSFQP